MSPLRLRAGAATDPGRVRSVNEDKALVDGELVAVADGMGGHAGGEVAAGTAIEALRRSYGARPGSSGLLEAVEIANRAVYDQASLDRTLRGMGTTLTAAAVVHDRSGDKVVVVNVGDSRAYLLDDRGLVQLTEDHSLVEEMVRRGELTPAEAAVHPHRHIVTRALGIDEEIEVDAWELEPDPGARLLLCSDGLTNEVGDAELAAVLAERRPPEETARELVARALSHGGSDNVTVVVVDFDDAGPGSHGTGDGASRARAVPVPAAAGVSPGSASPSVPTPPAGAATQATQAPQAPVSAAAAGAAGGPGSAAAFAGPATAAVSRVDGGGAPSGATPFDASLTATVSRQPAPPARGPAGATTAGSATAGPTVVARASGATTRVVTAASRPAVMAPAPAAPPARAARHERVMSLRVLLFVLLLVGVVGGATGFVAWFVKASYFVGLSRGQVVIEEGRPGGFLWFHPVVVELTGLSLSQVFPPMRSSLEAGMEEPSLGSARRVVQNLSNSSGFLTLPTGSTGRADGLPAGTTLVPISAPVPTVATVPPVAKSAPAKKPRRRTATATATATAKRAVTPASHQPAKPAKGTRG